MRKVFCPYDAVDVENLASGRIRRKPDKRTITLESVLAPGHHDIPIARDWTPRLTENPTQQDMFGRCRRGHTHFMWGKMLNATLSDCTVAAAGHMIQAWTFDATHLADTVSDDDVRQAYCGLTGWTGQGAKSPGSTCLDALNYWRKSGIGGHKINAFVGVRPRVRDDIKKSIHMFGSAYIGLALPLSAKPKVTKKGVIVPWTTKADDAYWINHAVCAVKYTEDELTVVTWGYEQRMTWDFYEKYSEEAYGVLSTDWINADGTAPNHIHLEKLEAYLNILSAWGALREVDKFDPHAEINRTMAPLRRKLEKYQGSGGEMSDLFPYLLQLAGDDENAHELRVWFEESLGT